MKIKDGFILKEIKGKGDTINYTIITVGEATKVLNGLISLNETSACIWKLISQGLEIDEIINKMAEEYDVDKTTIKEDVETFVDSLKKLGVFDD